MKSAAECFAFNVRLHRKKLKWTQSRLAEAAAISTKAVVHIESAHAWPVRKTVTALARAMKVKETVLFFDPDLPMSTEQALAVLERIVRKKH